MFSSRRAIFGLTVAMLVALAFAAWHAGQSGPRDGIDLPSEAQSVGVTEEKPTRPIDAAVPWGYATQPPQARDTESHEAEVLVVQVIDGDTVVLVNGEHVRYIGIDTPETVHPTKGVECFGPEATKRNRQLVEGKLVRMERDTSDRDGYGRLLRYVYVDDLFVNAVLVEEGYAYSTYFPPDTEHYQELLSLELMAEAQGVGLWQACPH